MKADSIRKILLTTSAFPRRAGDQHDMFILDLCRRLSTSLQIHVLAPRERGCPRNEIIDEVEISRHDQAPFNFPRIAYGSGIVSNLRAHPWAIPAIPWYLMLQVLAMRKIIRREQLKMVNAHWLIPQGLAAVWYKRMFRRKLKVVVTVHGSDLLGLKGGLGTRLKRYVLKHADGLIAVSHALQQEAERCGYRGPSLVCPMGTDTELFHPQRADTGIKKKYGIDGPFMLFVGSLIETKGIRVLLSALPSVLKAYPQLKLVVIGEGKLRQEMEEYCSKSGMAGQVIFTGQLPHEELPPWFATCDLFVLPSFSEGFGLVVAEAMASGAPALVSDLPSVRDLITDGEDGFLTTTGADVLARKINDILSHPAALDVVRTAARMKIVRNFDWQLTAARYIQFIESLWPAP